MLNHDIPKISAEQAIQLKTIGITNSLQLMIRTKTKEQRARLAKLTEITENDLLHWAQNAELSTIKGISLNYTELLALLNIYSVHELAKQEGHQLYTSLRKINLKAKKVKQMPGRYQVASWVYQAQKTKSKIEN